MYSLQGPCPLRGIVNISIAVPPGIIVMQLKGLILSDGIVEETWGHSSYFTVQEFPSSEAPQPPPPVTASACAVGSTVTIVTASILIEPNRHDFTRGLRYILNLGCPTVVYGDADAALAVETHLLTHPHHRITFKPTSISDLQSWRHYQALNARATPAFCKLINWTTQHSLYLSIVLLKPLWLLLAATSNEFETENVLWLDASPRCLGLLHTPMQLNRSEFGVGGGTSSVTSSLESHYI
jgi:hypothetical protein